MTGIGTLFGHHVRRYGRSLIPIAGGLGLFQFFITRIAPTQEDAGWLSNMFALVPPSLLAIAGDQIQGASPAGVLAIGYGHPFVLLLLGVWAVRVSSGALAGEIGLGTMDLLASRPVARRHHVIAGFGAVIAGTLVLVIAAWSGTAIGLAIRPLGVSATLLGIVAANLALLFVAWGSVGILVSATRHDGGSAMGWMAGLMAGSFVLEYLARVWHPMSSLRGLSLFAYYVPQQVVRTGRLGADAGWLVVVVLASLAAAVVAFRRRDL